MIESLERTDLRGVLAKHPGVGRRVKPDEDALLIVLFQGVMTVCASTGE